MAHLVANKTSELKASTLTGSLERIGYLWYHVDQANNIDEEFWVLTPNTLIASTQEVRLLEIAEGQNPADPAWASAGSQVARGQAFADWVKAQLQVTGPNTVWIWSHTSRTVSTGCTCSGYSLNCSGSGGGGGGGGPTLPAFLPPVGLSDRDFARMLFRDASSEVGMLYEVIEDLQKRVAALEDKSTLARQVDLTPGPQLDDGTAQIKRKNGLTGGWDCLGWLNANTNMQNQTKERWALPHNAPALNAETTTLRFSKVDASFAQPAAFEALVCGVPCGSTTTWEKTVYDSDHTPY